MAFWRKDNKQKNASTVVIAVRGDNYFVVRGYRDAAARAIKIQGEAIFSVENSDRLPELLREKVNWQTEDLVYFAKPSPLLLGASVTVNLPRYETGHPVILDTREAMHRIKWKTADLVREEAARYFGSSMEEIVTHSVTVERWRETASEISATLFHSCAPRFATESDEGPLSEAKQFLMPVVLSKEVGCNEQAEAILHTEDNLSTFVIRQNNQLKYLRSLNCGVAVIKDHLEKSLDCSGHETEVLMQQCLEGKLSESGQKITVRLMRELLPLWAGFFSVSMDNIPLAERPQKLLVTGLFPKMIAQLYCRPQLLMRWSHVPVKVTALTQDGDLLGMRSVLRMALKQHTRESNDAKITSSLKPLLQVVS